VINTTEPQSLLDGLFYVSGEIPRVTAFEPGFPGQHRQTEDGGWEPDFLLLDERWVGVHVKGKGLIVFTACSHAGVVNVLKHARDGCSGVPLHAVVGGFHLAGGNEKVIPETIEGLREFDLTTIAAAHCTGWRAILALTQAFGEPAIVPSAVGKRYAFS
jgi:7,8-dihydropterin-6-yl-methyl-4-(beta-D-ribofuranosyl)aminobenzene 5'-phosphate synthase